MKYKNTVRAEFCDRPNRFIAHVKINGVMETVHVKNTGRCRELLVPGYPVILEKSDNPARKTAYDLISVCKEGRWINMDSQAPNQAAAEWIQGAPTERGLKHVEELAECMQDGYEAYLLFVIQMKDVRKFQPNWNTHHRFGDALKAAREAGVRILAMDCMIGEDFMRIQDPVEVDLEETDAE